MNEVWVLDASALLAYLSKEPGSERVESVLLEGGCQISSVNFSEVASKLLDWGIAFDVVESLIGGLDLVVVPFDQSTALQAANLRAKTKTLGLSLGDRACLALAGISKGIAMTADRAWLQLDKSLELRVECIRS